MNSFRHRLTAIAAALALALVPVVSFQVAPAEAAVTVMCAPQLADTAAARTIGAGIAGTGSASSVPSGTTYVLNGQGCTIAQQADLGWFLSQGFSAGPPFGQNIIYTTGVLTGTTSVQIGTLPPSTYIQHIIVQNTTANAVTGGIAFGSTSSGTDVVTALTVGASALVFTTDSALSKRVFSTTASQPIYATAASAWNSANVTITIVYGYF